ncbi:hypothetical protein EYF80_048750 [Liparis tanakae]|uniref:Uncharacterized protein n=1 Tax=Liparis tanakae TaxID=230148 RepID=A0A4Z2FIR3_9TELE|nr:hypothetical protein EYF80_048750 [Liparis tanakae]
MEEEEEGWSNPGLTAKRQNAEKPRLKKRLNHVREEEEEEEEEDGGGPAEQCDPDRPRRRPAEENTD